MNRAARLIIELRSDRRTIRGRGTISVISTSKIKNTTAIR